MTSADQLTDRALTAGGLQAQQRQAADPDVRRRAVRTCARHAQDGPDLATLLGALGLSPSEGKTVAAQQENGNTVA